MSLRSTIALGLVILLATAIGCSGGDEPVETPGATIPTALVSPAPVPTVAQSTATPAPISSPGPTITPGANPTPPVEIDIATLTVPVCRTASNPSGVGFGTIPHATPTAIPGPGSSEGEDRSVAQGFVTALSPFVEAVSATTAAADDAWNVAIGSDDRARAVAFEGRRLSHLCSALSIVPLTTDGVELVDAAANTLGSRRDVLSNTAELLRDQPTSVNVLDEAREESSTALIGLKQRLDEFAADAGVTSAEPAAFSAVNPLLGVSFDAPAGWLVVRNGIDIVLMAPADQQIYSFRGLGPDAWKLGTALRIRRFRNNPPWELSDTASTLDSLYVRFGDRADEQSAVIGGVGGILRVYRSTGGDWETFVAATVLDNSTYLFEYGCPDAFVSGCAAQLDRFVESVVFADG